MWSSLIRPPLISSPFKPKSILKLKENVIQKLFKSNFKTMNKNPEVKQKIFAKQSTQNTPKLIIKYGIFSLSVFGACFTISPIIVYERMIKKQKIQRIQIVKKSSELRLKVK